MPVRSNTGAYVGNLGEPAAYRYFSGMRSLDRTTAILNRKLQDTLNSIPRDRRDPTPEPEPVLPEPEPIKEPEPEPEPLPEPEPEEEPEEEPEPEPEPEPVPVPEPPEPNERLTPEPEPPGPEVFVLEILMDLITGFITDKYRLLSGKLMPDFWSAKQMYVEWKKEIKREDMEEIVIEKLQMVMSDPENNQEKIVELWDDIQIMVSLDEDGDKEFKRKVFKIVEYLKMYIGDDNAKLLLEKIEKIEKKESMPQFPRAIKMPPSWTRLDDRPYQGVIITPPNY